MDFKVIIEKFYGLLGDFLKLLGFGDKLAWFDGKVNDAYAEFDEIVNA